MKYRIGIGQDSHRFLPEKGAKTCIVAGISFEETPGLDGDSDGDVVFHAICHAITSVTHIPILGGVAKELCHQHGITNSEKYLLEALNTLAPQTIEHVALSIEGKRPKFQKRCDAMRKNVARVLSLDPLQVGLSFTSGDGLTSFGRGEGLMCFCILTVVDPSLKPFHP